MKIYKCFLRWLPLLIILLILASVIYFQLYTYLSFESLKEHRQFLSHWTQEHFILASIIFMVVYIIAVAISIPGAIFLTLTGGFLFGLFYGTIYVVISATIGSIIIFLAMKTALRQYLEKLTGRFIKQMEHGFKENAFSYLMVLRLVPLFPFWVVNIVPALLGVSLRTFALTTFLGIIPGSFVYVWVGAGLSYIFESQQTPNLKIIFMPQILLPLLALAVLSIIPLLYKKIFRKNNDINKKIKS